MNFRLIYITAGSMEEARRIGKTLVEERLVACANVIDGVHSFYWWEGKVQEDNEVVLIAKTRADLVPDVVARVKAVHSYECPCVLALPVDDGNPQFLDWIAQETRH